MGGSATIKLAVLIDADKAQPSMAGFLLAEIAKYGTASAKRAYGDWTGSGLRGWKEQLLRNSIQPVQQFAHTQGKNASDAAMIIDAMDLLYSNRFDGFCLVSSDGDLTRLASRIRESGLVVYGCGERKTPQPFVTACDKFIYVENLVPRDEPPARLDQGPSSAASPARLDPGPSSAASSTLIDLGPSSAFSVTQIDVGLKLAVSWLRAAIEAISDDEGWAGLAAVGSLVLKRHPDFDPRTYGFVKLSDLIAVIPTFEVDRRIPGEGKAAVVYVRDKRRI